VRGVSSDTCTSREAEHHLKTMIGQGNLSRAQHLKNVETIQRLVHEDHRRTITDIAAIVNVSYGTVQTILTCDMNMHHIVAKFVPRLLTP